MNKIIHGENQINLIYKYVKENYDYCWLKSRLDLAMNNTKKGIIIVGSSHALNGFDVHCFNNAINCSMHSQDINYDLACLKSIILRNEHKPSIDKCFIVFGYYIPFQDISKGIGEYTKKMLVNIYNPVFKGNDDITWVCIKSAMGEGYISEEEKQHILKGALDIITKRKNYYNDLKVRGTYYNFNGKWKDLSEKDKDMYALNRTGEHNKHIKYKDSYNKNVGLLNEVVELLSINNIKPIIVIPPFTDAYNRHIEPQLKIALKDMINVVKNKADFIDFNEQKVGFNDDDFVDTDHLNGRGAYKLSTLLVERYGR